MKKVLLTGNEIVVKAALSAGANMFCGYPITPTTEVLTGWAHEAALNSQLLFLQLEDEPAAGFACLGGILAGKKAWTATAGPGNVLMQDPLSMAEAMRLPIVAYIGQRGGPSTGTVIYSQQEVNLTCFGGNGEGLRIVYSPSNLQELYDLTIKAFNTAWKYRFPTFILSDGYLGKMLGEVSLHPPGDIIYKAEPYLLNSKNKRSTNLRNCFSLEEELNEVLTKNLENWKKMSSEIMEFEQYFCSDAEMLVFAHGSVANASRVAAAFLREENIKVGVFRPITVWPFPTAEAQQVAKEAQKILIIESAQGQFGRLVKEALYGLDKEIIEYYKPALGITPEEISDFVRTQR